MQPKRYILEILNALHQGGDNVWRWRLSSSFHSSVPIDSTSLMMSRRLSTSGWEKLVPLLRIVDVVKFVSFWFGDECGHTYTYRKVRKLGCQSYVCSNFVTKT